MLTLKCLIAGVGISGVVGIVWTIQLTGGVRIGGGGWNCLETSINGCRI